MISDLNFYSSTSVIENFLLDTGATHSICIESWPQKVNWIPLKKTALPSVTKLFSFAVNPVQPLYDTLLAALFHYLHRKVYFLKIFAHILRPNLTPFLLGLVAKISLFFELFLRNGNMPAIEADNFIYR